MIPRPPGRWWLLALALVAVFAAGVGVGAVLFSQPGEVSNPDVAFEEAEPPPATVPPEPTGRRHSDYFTWPVYGYTNQRTAFLPLRRSLRPPFTFTWAVRGSVLLEFPPVAGRRSLYLLKNNGALYAIARTSGQVLWKRKLGYLAAASPAYAYGTVFAPLLRSSKSRAAGRIVAVRARDGKTRWSRRLPSRAESSPVVARGRIYFGSENGTVYALRTRDGSVAWTYRAPGAVKGGLALDSGKLYFGDYAGRVHAIRTRDGRKAWVKRTNGLALGRSGNFYSTPAVAYGRVYVGNTDGFVYSLSTRDGALAWRKRTGGLVYSSPAIAYGTVYVGSYDRRLYALSARTGRTRWSADARGRISGGPVVIGDLVFVSTLSKTTLAYGARTGRRVWATDKGAFNPAISDGERIFLVGYSSLFSMKPREGRPPGARQDGGERRPAPRRGRVGPRHRSLLHGHRHRGRGDPPRCHRHRHRRGRVVYPHTHCHRHVRRHR